ncbi:MAG TPA: Asp-tRNA(Asn)/Glu-tRNA(Gln) amidotransferase GatCAB subunit C [Firmicutes bacterium]|jgi:aspartyl/glutamyl-tRNA(Asn/Gln) amidotransferase C subunit|nr:Asp-tRNA(Asn)/Glu-tRNA(Gln) amidotransferase GatCAB subunit C [Bacillota bacterium]
MTKITKAVLKKAASNLLFDMTDEQYEVLTSEFDILLCQMDLIGKIPDLDNVAPMTFPYDTKTDYLRDDVALNPTPTKEILKNATYVEDNQIKVPKVIG